MTGSVAKRPNGKWRARYRDADGQEHARHFTRRADAWTWLDHVTSPTIADLVAGVDVEIWLPMSRDEVDDLLHVLAEVQRTTLRVQPHRRKAVAGVARRLRSVAGGISADH